MARDVSNFIKITVPILLLRKHADLRDELQAAALAAGGATSHEANGIWFDARGTAHEERVYVFTFNFTDESAVRVDRATRRVVDALFLLGEQAVMKERNYTERTSRIRNRVQGPHHPRSAAPESAACTQAARCHRR
ncbi:hypothetical protein [Stenotrophomonas phage vB_SmeS_BUCT700]|uniref:Uncharacterized protein n=1 Tax=Stenotrophomonas phage vB_SmeS_BUCT700 TaxID=2924895 RepID=A0AAE9GCG4_9CAUD|nr:hypothetical protein [Stenotrophomonas phage vB_SmeS_BUCT700]